MADLSDMAGDAARLYHAGRCPCCGSKLYEWTDSRDVTYQPAQIGEGVLLCGRCIGNEHHETQEVVEFILRDIIMNPRSRAT